MVVQAFGTLFLPQALFCQVVVYLNTFEQGHVVIPPPDIVWGGYIGIALSRPVPSCPVLSYPIPLSQELLQLLT